MMPITDRQTDQLFWDRLGFAPQFKAAPPVPHHLLPPVGRGDVANPNLPHNLGRTAPLMAAGARKQKTSPALVESVPPMDT